VNWEPQDLVEFSVDVNLDDASIPDCLEQAIAAEQVGFDRAWLSDHFHPWTHTDAHESFCWVMLAAVLGKTKKLSVSTAVTTPTFRYHPAIVAQAFATLGILYPGRVSIGVGAGEAMNEAPLGFEWPSAKERAERLEEAVKIIKLLWNEDFVSFKGKYYTLDAANLYDKPSTPVPLYVASRGPVVTRMAGALADGYLTPFDGVGGGAAYVKEKLFPILERGAIENGRDPKKIRRCAMIGYSYDEDYDTALELCRKEGANLVPNFFNMGIHDPRKVEALAAPIDRNEFKKIWAIITEPEELIGKTEEAMAMGFDEIVFQGFSRDQTEFFRKLGTRVLPSLRDAHR
jgi:coenzyme F420-dependent glucose-6-phosphate dehydrogenase